VWDTLRGEIVKRFEAGSSATKPSSSKRSRDGSSISIHHSSPIKSVVWSNDGTKLYSTAEDSSTIIEWDYASGKAVRAMSGSKNNVGYVLALSSDGASLFAASSEIDIIDVASGKRVRKMQGHSLPATRIVACENDSSVLASISNEPNVLLWDSNSVDSVSPAAVLNFPMIPISVSVIKSSKSSKTYYISATSENGTTRLWRYKRSKDGVKSVAKPFEASSWIVLESAGASDGHSKDSKILSSRFSDPSTLLVLVGPVLTPTFYRVPILSDDESLIKGAISLKLLPLNKKKESKNIHENQVDEDLEEEPHSNRDVDLAGVSRTAVVDGNIDHAQVLIPKVATVSSKSLKSQIDDPLSEQSASMNVSLPEDAEHEINEVESGMTLGDRVSAVINAIQQSSSLSVSKTEEPKASSSHALLAAQTVATTGSLTSILSQALTSGDDSMVELVLSYNERTVIFETVSKLPTSSIVPFLSKLIMKLQARPGRGAQLTSWLRVLLNCHTGYLLTLHDLVDRLSSLYSLLETRLAAYKKMLKLQGRLDLIVARLASNSSSSEKNQGGFSRTVKKAKKLVAQATLDASLAAVNEVVTEEEDAEDAENDIEEVEEGLEENEDDLDEDFE
jgi:U3 small nucleolar RNA-associated protein 5